MGVKLLLHSRRYLVHFYVHAEHFWAARTVTG